MDNDAGDARVDPAGKSPPKTPRWVKVFGIIGLVIIVLAVIALATSLGGPGGHGPGRHSGSGDGTPTGNHTSGSHTPPPTHHTEKAAVFLPAPSFNGPEEQE